MFFLFKKARTAGEEWMLTGPLEYVPPIEVEVVTVRQAIPLDENEGIYVREKRSGQVRAVIGSTYMPSQDEELWTKKLSPAVEQILRANKDPQDPTRVVSYRVPHNAAVQIYDYKGKKSRVVFGPERVLLGPDEEFTLLSLSGGKPKRTNMIKTICLLLGPDFCTDVLVVETADHARDFCRAIAARVRGIVASVNFDRFHKNSASLIRQSVFGIDAGGKIGDRLVFPQNNLVVTSVDVQAVEPVDQRTRDALQKSVQLAIEITSNSQEAAARQEAERLDQEARGKLERQRIEDEAKAEEARRGLLELQVQLAALESTGQAKAEVQSRVEAALISSQAEVEKAKLEAEAGEIKADVEIETSYFLKRVEALGAENLRHIACAGPERDVRMLRALNLKSTLITDGRSPVNLLDATSGLIGQARSTIHVRQPEDEVVAPESVTEEDDNDECRARIGLLRHLHTRCTETQTTSTTASSTASAPTITASTTASNLIANAQNPCAQPLSITAIAILATTSATKATAVGSLTPVTGQNAPDSRTTALSSSPLTPTSMLARSQPVLIAIPHSPHASAWPVTCEFIAQRLAN
ncbi:hypothetical protein SprV_0401620200 [Sparganum proliferum]